MRLPNLKRHIAKTFKQPAYAFKVGLARLMAHLYYYYADGRAPNPESLTFFLTHKCNLHCVMCGQWGEGGITKKQSTKFIMEELPVEALYKVIDEIAAFSPSITLFGGEPLLHKNCIDIIRYIKAKKMHCLMITNGFLIHDHANELVASGLDELNVSLDGPRDLHDQIRGLSGLFERIMKGLELIHTLKHSCGSKKPLVNIQCTITRYNYHRLEEMLAVADCAHADSLTFHNLIFTDKETLCRQKKYDELLGSSSADWEGFDFEPGIDTALLHKKMELIRSGRYNFDIDFYPNFTHTELDRYYNDPDFVPGEYPARCLSPWLAAYLFPDGNIRPCLNGSYTFGNIKDGNFNSIWNSRKAIHYRQALKKNALFPACVRCTELYRY